MFVLHVSWNWKAFVRRFEPKRRIMFIQQAAMHSNADVQKQRPKHLAFNIAFPSCRASIVRQLPLRKHCGGVPKARWQESCGLTADYRSSFPWLTLLLHGAGLDRKLCHCIAVLALAGWIRGFGNGC